MSTPPTLQQISVDSIQDPQRLFIIVNHDGLHQDIRDRARARRNEMRGYDRFGTRLRNEVEINRQQVIDEEHEQRRSERSKRKAHKYGWAVPGTPHPPAGGAGGTGWGEFR